MKHRMKKYVYLSIAIMMGGIFLFVLDHIVFTSHVNSFNYMLIRNGMSERQVRWLLGSYMNGYQCIRHTVRDSGSPNGFREIRGDKILFFQNIPPDSSGSIYVGFVNDQVVDKYHDTKK